MAGLVFAGACGDNVSGETESAGNTDSGSAGSSSSGGFVPTSAGTDTLTGGSATDSATDTGNPPTSTSTEPTTAGPTSDTGNETVSVDTGNETVNPDTGNETVNPDTGNETVNPDTGNETVDPDTGNETVDPDTGDTGNPVGPCDDGKLWTLDADFDEGVLANVNHDDPNNDQLQITVDGFSPPKPYMFIGQTNDGWVLKVDTVTGKQLARYASVRLADCPTCTPNQTQWYPSRIIVDFDGDMYVANRAFGSQGSLTKIAGDPSACLDRNNNGTIETSKDANNDGFIDINNPAEYFGQNDECVLYTFPVGGSNMLPRALTLDGKGNAYVGTYSDMKAYKLDITVSPPVILKTINLPSTPYGFSIRGDYLYSSALGSPVMRVDLKNDSVVTMNAPNNYGIGVDDNGIAWYAGGGTLSRCDFDIGGNCQTFPSTGSAGVAIDAFGQVWAAGSGQVQKFTNTGVLLGSAPTPTAYGAAIGHDGNLRVIGNYDAYSVINGGDGTPPGAVTKYETGLFNGTEIFNYTYSDFTGFGAQNVTVKKGEWLAVYDSGQNGTNWGLLTFNDEPEGKIPAGTSITFQVRAANVQADLNLSPWKDVVDGKPAEPTTGRYIELRARLLISDDMVEESPVLSDVCLKPDV